MNLARNLSMVFLVLNGIFTVNVFAEIPDPTQDKSLIYDIYGIGDYLQHAYGIDPNRVKSIFEIGSRDAIDAIILGRHYNCPVYAFECNPQALERCYHNVKNYPYVTIVPQACWDKNELIPFYPVVGSRDESIAFNLGGSSCLVARKDGCESKFIQGAPITIPAERLDTWMEKQNIEQVDLICMDCQGATMKVLEGLGNKLNKVRYIITEVYLLPGFEGESLYPAIKNFFASHGFYPKAEPNTDRELCDILFINSQLN